MAGWAFQALAVKYNRDALGEPLMSTSYSTLCRSPTPTSPSHAKLTAVVADAKREGEYSTPSSALTREILDVGLQLLFSAPGTRPSSKRHASSTICTPAAT